MKDEFRPGTAVAPTTTIEISISCQNLLDKDILSRSDPICVVYTQPWVSGRWEEFMRTEVIWDNLNPEFTTKIRLDYRFEEEQPLRFVVYDIDSDSSNLEDHDLLGFAECTLGRIVSGGFHGIHLPLRQDLNKKYATSRGRSQSQGILTLIAEELVALKEEITLQLSGMDMGACCFGYCYCRVYYTISKSNEGGKYILVWKSPSSPGPSPEWRECSLPMSTICNGDKERALKIEFFRLGFQGYDTSIGSIYTNVNRLLACAKKSNESLPVTGPNGQLTSSWMSILKCKISPLYTFLDYVQGGTQIHCSFAIDMTGSNGDPNDPTSLHYLGARTDWNPLGNPYEQAIQAVGDIIQDYNQSKAFPAYGFGARIPPLGEVSHKFPLNLKDPSPFCDGIAGVLKSYRKCLRKIQLYGPTHFAPIIRDVASMALRHSRGTHYFVLLMITDGIIGDMEETKQEIINASTLPMSIIIVGVGSANFDAMEVLDGDTVRLSYGGREASRDIVQFVPYRDAISWVSRVAPSTTSTKYAIGFDSETVGRVAKLKLAQEVLAEIPSQLTSYMKSRGIVPMTTS